VDSYDGSAIFLVDAPNLEPPAPLGETGHGETAKLRDQALPPRLLVRLGDRLCAIVPRTMVPHDAQQDHKLIGRSHLCIVA